MVPRISIFHPTLFPLYINDISDNNICNMTIYSDDTTLYAMFAQASNSLQQLVLASDPESLNLRQVVTC